MSRRTLARAAALAPADIRWGKRVLSVILSLALCLTLLPVHVWAEEPETVHIDGVSVENTEPESPEIGAPEALKVEENAAVSAVQALINALPAADALDDMTGDALDAAYADVQVAYDAYEALSGEQQAQITGADCFEALFGWFNGQIALLAGEDPSTTEDPPAESAAKIGENSYASLQKALDAAQNGDTITLQKDIVAGASDAFVFDGNKAVTLDMNGHSITGQNNDWKGSFLNVKSGTLVIKDTVGEFITIRQEKSNRAAVILVSGGTLQFENKVKITGCLKFTDSGKLEGGLPLGSMILYNNYGDTISVEESNIYRLGEKNQIAALLDDGYAFAKCNGDGQYLDANNAVSETPLLRSGESTSQSVIVISHPTCSFENTGACACGRPCPHTDTNSDGNCAACGTTPEAKIGGSYHWTLQSALDAAQDGDAVTLLKAQDGRSCTYSKTGAITIDLNGNTWSNAYGTPLTISSGRVTLKNGRVLGGDSGSNQRGIDVAKNAGLTLGENMVVKGTGGWVSGPGSGTYKQGIYLASGITSQLMLSEGSVVLGGLYLNTPSRTPDSYLPAGTALVRCTYDETTGTVTPSTNEDGSLQYVTEAYPTAWYFNGDMTVMAHTHDLSDNGVCVCGLTAAAEVDGTIYSTVSDAANAAGGKTVKLLVSNAGLDESLTVTDGETLTIDLNGNTLSAAVTVLGTLTLTSSAAGDGAAASVMLGGGTTDGTLQIPDGKVRIESLTVANKTAAPLPSQGRYHAISCTGGLTLGDLLPQPDADGTRYAFKSMRDGKYILRSSTAHDEVNTSCYAFIQSCTVHGAWDNGLCGYCGYACPHGSTDNDGKCTICGGQFAALLNTNTGAAAKSCATLSEAVDAANAAPGSTLQLLLDITAEQSLTSTGTWTLDLHGKTLPNTSFTVESGTLTVMNRYTGAVGNLKSVTVKNGGKLEIPAYTGGCVAGIDTVTVEAGGSAALGYGDTVYGSIENKNPNGTLHDLLGDGCAFASAATGDLINGYTASTAADVKVAAHSDHTIGAGFACPCGFTCDHLDGYPDGKCPICGTLCPHDNVTGSGDTYTCGTCGQTMAVRVTNGDATTYYAKTFDGTNTEHTLRTVFNAVESGSTVTLLEGGLRTFSFVKDGKTLTLNLNGKSLLETYENGIAVDPGSTLTVTGQGSSEVLTDQAGRPSFVFNARGGTLVLDSDFRGSFGRIRVGTQNGTAGTLTFNGSAAVKYLDIDHSDVHITLNGGTFGCIAGRDTFTGSMAANSLLPKGYAFRKADGSFVKYGTELTVGSTLENVTVVKCPHPSINNHGGSTDRWCDSCDKPIAAELETAAGAFTYYEDFNTALDAAQKSAGCTLTVYEDGCKLNITGGNFTLELYYSGIVPAEVGSEFDFHYALRVLKGAAVTVKNLHVAGDHHNWSSKKYTGSVYVSDGASLTLVGCEVQDLRAVFTGGDTPSTVKLDNSNICGTLYADHCNLIVDRGYVKNLSALARSTVEIRGGQVETLDAYGAKSLKLSGGDFRSITAPDDPEDPKEKTITGCLAEGYVLWENSSVIGGDVNSLPAKGDTWYGVGLPPFKDVQAVNPTVITTYGQSATLNTGIDCGGSTLEFTLTWYCNDVQQGDPIAITPSSNSYSLPITPASAGTHTYRLVFIKWGYSEECTFTVTVAPAALTNVSVTQTDELIYNGQPQTATVDAKAAAVNNQPVTFTYSDRENGTYSETVPAFTDAGEHTVYYKISAPNHETISGSFTVTIAPKIVDNPTIEVASGSVYNGEAQTPTVTVKDGENTIDPSEYTVTYSDNVNAGENTATVTITDNDGGNYIVSGSAKFTIAKAGAPALADVTHSQKYTVADGTVSLADAGMPAGAGTLTYSKGTESVNGVSSWNVAANGDLTYTLTGGKSGDTVTLPVTIGSANYENATVNVVITLTDRDEPTVSTMTIKATYTGGEISAQAIRGTATFGGQNVAGTWSWKGNPARTNVSDSGEKAVVFTPDDQINYKPVEATVQLTIDPATLTNVSVQQSGELTYIGQTQYVTVAASATAVNNQTVTFTYSHEQDGYYAEQLPVTNAGEFTMFFKASAPNHEDFFGTLTVKMSKAEPICEAPTGLSATYGQPLSEITLTNPDTNTPGEWTWTDGTQSVGKAGENTFTAKFTPDDQLNYNSKDGVTVTVTVHKAASTVSSAPAAKTLTYNGTAQELVSAGATADGTLVYSLSENGDYSETIPTGTKAGEYTVWYKVMGDDNHNDSKAESVSVTVGKAKVTVTASNKSAYVGDTAPDLSKPELDKDYTVSGLFGEDQLPAAPTLKYVDADGKEIVPDMTKSGETLIRVDGKQSDNYVIVYVAGKLTVTNRPSSGGSSSTTKTETTTNPDGSTTRTETKSDGTVTETTTRKDGSTTKTETKPDGSSKTEVKDASGSTGTVNTDKNGNTSAEAKVSDKAVSDAKKSDEAVKVPTEVTPGEDSKSAPTVKIDLPSSSGETKVEIPIKDVTPGTVAVIVKPDGTEEIVKDSVPTENGIQLTVEGDVTVKIVNNAKGFTDTKGHWAEESIDFVSARGLVNGTSDSTFSPNAPTTRAQLWTILARQAGADLTGGASWYEKAQAWAKANGISDGSNPNGTITRAQMVTMLWRAAGSPEVATVATFTDVPAGSYYAKAVAWAVAHGITTGVGNGKFDPNGTCTRAQIATFLHRSYLNK